MGTREFGSEQSEADGFYLSDSRLRGTGWPEKTVEEWFRSRCKFIVYVDEVVKNIAAKCFNTAMDIVDFSWGRATASESPGDVPAVCMMLLNQHYVYLEPLKKEQRVNPSAVADLINKAMS